MSFSDDLDKFKDSMINSAIKSVAGLTEEAFDGIVDRTPLESGRAKSNWVIDDDVSLAKGSSDSTAYGANKLVQKSKIPNLSKKAVEDGKDINISNNLPYIRQLEYGRSKEAPNGMVRTTTNKLKARYGGI